MKPRHLIPFVVLLFWQVAPVQVEQGPTGRLRLSLGVGGGSFPYDYTGCGGGTETGTARFSSMGAEFEDRTAAGIRISAFAGGADLQGTASNGGYVGGAQLAWEGRVAGVGGGWVGAGGIAGHGGLSAYLRLGNEDEVHLRADLRQPTPTWLVSGWARAGIAYDMGLRRRFGGFVGISRVLGYMPMNSPPRDETAVFADGRIPLGGKFDLLVRWHLGHRISGFGVGARYTFP